MRTKKPENEMAIGKTYKVTSDELNVTVMVKMINKHKNNAVYWTPIAYFATIKHALKYIVDRELNLTGLDDFRKVVAKQEELYTLINGLRVP